MVPNEESVPAVAGVESIQSKIADLIKLTPKKDSYGEENTADRATIIKSIRELRAEIAALKASDLGVNADQLIALKAQFYLQINKATPSYFQMENLDILWSMDKGRRTTSPGRTCNVTALSISLESLGISSQEFKGDKELLKLIWKYQQDQMSETSKKNEETAISKLKGESKEKQEAVLRAKGEQERTRLASLDLDGLRMPDFMQLIVIYNVLLKTGAVTGKMNGLGLDAGTIKAMAAGQPDKFKETMDSAHGLARNSILFSAQFRYFAGWFGITANPRYPGVEEVPDTVLINPAIALLTGETEEGWEGCLSVPGMRGVVPRALRLRYSGCDEQGKPFTRDAEGFHARVVQHECDHLAGILYPMRMRDFRQFGFTDILFPDAAAAEA
jgi:peptide deformylase